MLADKNISKSQIKHARTPSPAGIKSTNKSTNKKKNGKRASKRNKRKQIEDESHSNSSNSRTKQKSMEINPSSLNSPTNDNYSSLFLTKSHSQVCTYIQCMFVLKYIHVNSNQTIEVLCMVVGRKELENIKLSISLF